MTRECFKKQTDILLAVFGSINPTKEKLNIWYDLLKDIEDDEFKRAVEQVCNKVKEVYTGTNIIALIRAQIETTSDKEDKPQLLTNKGFIND